MAVTDSTILTGVINICVNKYAENGPEYKSFYPQTETAQIVDFNDATGEIIDNRLADYEPYGNNGTIKAKNLIAKNNINVVNSTITQSLKVSDKADIEGTLTAKNITATNSIVIKNGSDVTLQLNNNGEITAALKGNADTASALELAKSIDGVQFNGVNNIHHFGISYTPGQNQEKLVTFPGDMENQASSFVINDGLIIAVKFTQANDADNPKIKIGTNAAIPMYYQNSVIPKKAIKANSTYVFVYDAGKLYLLGDLNVYYTNQLFVTSTTNGTSNETTDNDNTYLRLIEKDNNNNLYQGSSIKIKGSNDVTVSSSNGTITISSNNNYVEQNNTTKNTNYPILFKNGTGENKTTNSVLFNQSITVNPSNGTITANKFKGALDGNASTATKLNNTRNINIQDNDGTNTGTAINFDGSADGTITLPSTIKANLTGTADKAERDNKNNIIDETYIKNIELNSGLMVLVRGDDTKQELDATRDTYVTQINATTNTDYPILLKNGTGTDSYTGEVLFSSGITVNPSSNNITATNFTITANKFKGTLDGKADKAEKDNKNNTIDETYIKGITVNGSIMTATYGSDKQVNITLPAGVQSTDIPNDHVTQSLASDNVDYPVLLKKGIGTNSYTGEVLFSSSITINPSTNVITAKKFKGDLVGNANTATNLANKRNINIQDNDGTNTGTAINFDGSDDGIITLPSTIKANLTGTADKAIYDSTGHKFEDHYATKSEINTGTIAIGGIATAITKETTLIANSWIDNNDPITKMRYPKQYIINDNDITEKDIIEVIIKFNSQETANVARLSPVAQSEEHKIILLSRNTPFSNIDIIYYIYSITSNSGGGDDTTQGGGTDTQQGGGDDTQQGGGDDTQQGGGTDTTQGGGDDTQQGGGDDTQQGGGDDTQQGGGTDTTQGGGTDTQQGGGDDTTPGSGTDEPVIIYTNEYIDRLGSNNLTITADDWTNNTNNSYANVGYKFSTSKEIAGIQSEYDIVDVALANIYKAQGKYYNMLKAASIYPVVNITKNNNKYYINLYAKQQPTANIPVTYYSYNGIDSEKLDSSAYMPKVYSRTTTISATPNKWVQDSIYSNYHYRYEITDADITEYSIVEMIIHAESQQIAKNVNIMPTIVSEKGKFYIYAKSIPSDNINITWRLYHGAEDNKSGDLNQYMFKNKINSLTLSSSDWKEEQNNNYNYKYDIVNINVTVNDIVEVIINSSYKDIATNIDLCPMVETVNGHIYLYCVKRPTSNIAIEYYIYQGKVNSYTTSTTSDELENLVLNTETPQGSGDDTQQGGGTDTTSGGGTDTQQGGGTDTQQGGGTDTTQGGGTDTQQGGGTDTQQGGGTDTTQGGGTDTQQGGETDTTQGGGTDTTQGGGTDTTQGGGDDTTQGGGTDEPVIIYTNEYIDLLNSNNLTITADDWTSNTNNSYTNAGYKFTTSKEVTDIQSEYDIVDVALADMYKAQGKYYNMLRNISIYPVVNVTKNNSKYYINLYAKQHPAIDIPVSYHTYRGINSEKIDDSDYMPKLYSRTTEISNIASAWISSDNSIYPYKYEIINNDITEYSIVEMIVNIESKQAAEAANIMPTVVSEKGKFYVYAKFIPTTAINITWRLYHGADKNKIGRDAKYMFKNAINSLTLTSSDWKEEQNNNYNYKYDIENANVTVNDIVEIIINSSYKDIATDIDMCSIAKTIDGHIYLYSMKRPTSNIAIEYYIYQGATNGYTTSTTTDELENLVPNTDTTQGGGTDTTSGGGDDTPQGGGTDTTQGGGTDTTQGGSTDTQQGGGTDTTQGGSTDTTQGGGTDEPEPQPQPAKEYMERIDNNVTAFSINNTSGTGNDEWTTHNDTIFANYPYKYTKSITGITANDVVDVFTKDIVDNSTDINNIVQAEICPVVSANDNELTIYSKYIPKNTINNMAYRVYQGTDFETNDNEPYMPKLYSRTTEISNTTSAWTSSNNSVYPYKYEIADEDITANDVVEVIIHPNSKEIAKNANIMPTVVSEKGKFYVYAESIPTATINIVWRLYHGAEDNKSGDLTQYMFKKKINSVSLQSTDWNALTTAYKGYKYKYSINVAGLTTNDIVEVIINSTNKNTVSTAGMCPVVETAADYINLYSIYQPTTDIQAEYYIYQGK